MADEWEPEWKKMERALDELAILYEGDCDPETAHLREDDILWQFVRLVADPSRRKSHTRVAEKLLEFDANNNDRRKWYA